MYTKAQQLLMSESETDRCEGIDLIANVGEHSSIDLLVMQLEIEQSTFVRRRLIMALGALKLPYTALTASCLLASEEAYVRNAALAIMQLLGEVAVPKLAELMNHQDRDLRKQAAEALDKIPGDVVCSLLLGGLGDHDPNVVTTCAEALGNRRDFRIVPALTAALAGTENVWVAFGLIESLVKTGNGTILKIIEQCVNKTSWSRPQYVTLASLWAVAAGQLGDERQLPAAWALYADQILSIGQMITLLDVFQGRGINLYKEKCAIESMLKTFFADTLIKKSNQEMIAAIRIANRQCPTLLEDE